MNPTGVAESFGGRNPGIRTVVRKRADASNALAPRNEAAPEERPSEKGCSTRGVVSSDASNALAPHTAFASAAGNFDDGFFDDAVAAGVLASCVASSEASRGIGRMWLPTTGIIVRGRIHISQDSTSFVSVGGTSGQHVETGVVACRLRACQCRSPQITPQELECRQGGGAIAIIDFQQISSSSESMPDGLLTSSVS